MCKEKLLRRDLSGLKKAYDRDLPFLTDLAVASSDVDHFLKSLSRFVFTRQLQGVDASVLAPLQRLLDYEGRCLHELSTGGQLQMRSLALLRSFLCERPLVVDAYDVFLDLYHLFVTLLHPSSLVLHRAMVEQHMRRWPNGLDEEVMEIRRLNKERIITALVRKIDKRYGSTSVHVFAAGMEESDKRRQVEEWWRSSRFQLAMAVKSPTELNTFLGDSLSEEIMQRLSRAKKKGMPFFVTPYYLSLLNIGVDGYDDSSIRSYVLYSDELVDTYGDIKAWEKEDVLRSGEPNAAGWLLPEGHNIHRRYPEVAILIPDSMGRACGGLCAPCQRMYDFQSKRLNFDFESLKPKESWDKKLLRLMNYFEEDSQLRDILITGGDALMSQNATLRKILEAVYKMAVRKRKANLSRPDGEKYAEIMRVRLGTRLLAYLPFRINEELVDILRDFRERALSIGIQQFIIQTHFQSPLEITPEARRGLQAVLAAGWVITNQLVYTVAASRRGHTAKLRQALNAQGVVCYYTFSVKGFAENYSVFTPICRQMQERCEEKIFGEIPSAKQEELREILHQKQATGALLRSFLERNRLLFAATDRSVLNLPAIGKSMSFVMVGLTSDGKRVLRFDHDRGRVHSPIIDQMDTVYIVENKSVAAYLRQLVQMGERASEYSSLWDYREGHTEARFGLYEYPSYSFKVTTEMTHLQLEAGPFSR